MQLKIEAETVSLLEELARTAGAKLLEYWPGNPQHNGSLAVTDKADGSPVTAADLASNSIIIEGLRKLFPDFGILSEEIPDRGDLESKNCVWIIDPLDGTRSFVKGYDDFSVLMGLTIEGSPRFGIMYFPARNVMAIAEKGKGTLINGVRGEVSKAQDLRSGSLYYRNLSLPDADYLHKEWMDSGMAFLALCRGELDGVVIRMTAHKEWDIAAPIVVVEESGGQVSDENGEPITFSKSEMNFKYLVASNGLVHERLLELIEAAEAAS
ncbi:MAG: 3'(2'),5'-bisphosphate nucleotidase CysQ [Deltaproteobacteria bacterium]|nr:3'(2'),5'-bisphosphate nucleotidase CysQ [Deltaproteobacteria bacterium]